MHHETNCAILSDSIDMKFIISGLNRDFRCPLHHIKILAWFYFLCTRNFHTLQTYFWVVRDNSLFFFLAQTVLDKWHCNTLSLALKTQEKTKSEKEVPTFSVRTKHQKNSKNQLRCPAENLHLLGFVKRVIYCWYV